MVAEMVKTIADLLEVILPILNIAIVGGDLKADLNKAEIEIRNELTWTGEKGYLLYVPVGQSTITHQLDYGGLRTRGSGNSPESVLALSIGKDKNLERPVPANLSEEHTFYIWFDNSAGRWGIVLPEHTAKLKAEALAIWNDTSLLKSIEDKRKNEIFAHAIDVLQARLKNDSIKAIVLEGKRKIREHRDAIAEIQKKLAAALEKDRQAAAFRDKIQMWKNIISVGQLVAEAQSSFPDAGVKTGDDVVTLDRKVNEYKIQQGAYILRVRQEMELQKTLTNDEAKELEPILRDAGAPVDIVNWSL